MAESSCILSLIFALKTFLLLNGRNEAIALRIQVVTRVYIIGKLP
jgi:hypothetical protein